MFGKTSIPIKIALVAGGLMVYHKEDDTDKYNLCFGIPETKYLEHFYFSVSASTGPTNVFTYDITDLKIFSDI